MTLESEICLDDSHTNCFDYSIELPLWLQLILIGSAILISKEIYHQLT